MIPTYQGTGRIRVILSANGGPASELPIEVQKWAMFLCQAIYVLGPLYLTYDFFPFVGGRQPVVFATTFRVLTPALKLLGEANGFIRSNSLHPSPEARRRKPVYGTWSLGGTTVIHASSTLATPG